MLNRWVLSRDRKTATEGAEVTRSGRLVASVKQRPHTPWSVITTVISLPLRLPSCSRRVRLVALQPGVSLLYWRYHAAARSVADFWPRHHVTAALMALHWLPVRHRIPYKLCTLMHAVVYGNGPEYLMDMVVSVSPLTGRSHQRSAQKGDFDIPRTQTTYESRSFCCSCSSTDVESLDGWHSTALRRFLLQDTSQELSIYDCIFLLAQHMR